MVTQAKKVQEQKQAVPAEPLIRGLDDTPREEKRTMTRTIVVVYVFLIALGTGTGYLLAKTGPEGGTTANKGEMIQTDTMVGISDSQTFSDSAEGTLQAGGINGEGTHQLVREGGPSQTVYLTSSVIDLEEFVGKRVTVWGQTMAAQKAGWLMDVGKIELK